jgi:hypothetical protein
LRRAQVPRLVDNHEVEGRVASSCFSAATVPPVVGFFAMVTIRLPSSPRRSGCRTAVR